jgi:hypothetical protein
MGIHPERGTEGSRGGPLTGHGGLVSAPTTKTGNVPGTVQRARLADESLKTATVFEFYRSDAKQPRDGGDERSLSLSGHLPHLDFGRASALASRNAHEAGFGRLACGNPVEPVARCGAR